MIHTELFTQYIANNGGAENALPSLFDKVPNITIDDEVTTFKDAFILNFCDREIGFETEELFALKLESRAKLVLPFYINKLKQLASIDYINAKRTESEKRTSTGSAQDTGSDTITRESTGSAQDSGKDTNTRFKGENPLIDTTLTFNAKAVSEQEKVETEFGKTTTSSGSGSDVTSYGKKTDTTGNENVTREYTDSGIEARDLYERVLNDTMNVWNEIFKKFDSLFMQVW